MFELHRKYESVIVAHNGEPKATEPRWEKVGLVAPPLPAALTVVQKVLGKNAVLHKLVPGPLDLIITEQEACCPACGHDHNIIWTDAGGGISCPVCQMDKNP